MTSCVKGTFFYRGAVTSWSFVIIVRLTDAENLLMVGFSLAAIYWHTVMIILLYIYTETSDISPDILQKSYILLL